MLNMAGLSTEQINSYRENGFLIFEDAFDATALEPLKAELTQRIDNWVQQGIADGLLNDPLVDLPFHQRLSALAGQLENPEPLLRQAHGKLRSAAMFDILTNPELLDVVESVIGAEILAHPQFNLRAKLPHQDAGIVPWHQDLGYLEADAEETFMVNFWIPLVDATQENGCMEVIADSHRAPLIAHTAGMGPAGNFKGLDDDQLPPGERTMCPVRLGGIVLLQHKTIHRSVPNVSDHIRWSLDLRYCDPRLPTGRDDVPGFIARSAENAEPVCRSVEQWQSIVAANSALAGA
jgi:phytanoyl-CoA hydroxylase